MKNLRGGCDGGYYIDPEYAGTCGYKGPGSPEPICSISQEAAMLWVQSWKGYYCCDSCKSNGGTADYC